MNACEIEEYRALRATIRERGTARVWIGFLGLTAWAALAGATLFVGLPLAALLPLLVLGTAFEAVFSLHVGVERIGRYLQVFVEEGDEPGPSAAAGARWEHHAMAYGTRFPGGPDPLFAHYFALAAVLNTGVLADAAPTFVEWLIGGAAHLLLLARIAMARRQAGRQRATDLERFRQLKADALSSGGGARG